ncbi:MAG: hypothetical protein Q9227_001799 [Pyrenula ochraceoflavens]
MAQLTPQPKGILAPRKNLQRKVAQKLHTPSEPPVADPTDRSPPPPPPSQPAPRSVVCSVDCPKPDIGRDEEGNLVCRTCGAQVEESQLVNDVGFTETSAGAAVATGTRISQYATHARSSYDRGGFRRGEDPISSSEQTTLRATTEIKNLARAVNVVSRVSDQATQLFRLCGPNGFVQGRSVKSVSVVCLYIACRLNVSENKVMLIDLAEKAQINVFKLGQLYTKVVRALRLDQDLIAQNNGEKVYIPPVAPETYVQRFAAELEFGSKRQIVVRDAVRVLRRMQRDWMTHGRRWAGVCGAALIVAARMNNFRRTVREVVYVVKVCEVTLSKRLEEFQLTDDGRLTVNEFRNLDMAQTEADIEAGRGGRNPPAFDQPIAPKRKRGRPRKDGGNTAAELEGDDSDTVVESVRNSSKRRRVDKDGFAIPDAPNSNVAQTKSNDTDFPSDSTRPSSGATTAPVKRGRGRPKGSRNKPTMTPTHEDLAYEHGLESDMRNALENYHEDSSSLGASPQNESSSITLDQARRSWPNPDEVAGNPIIDEREFEDDPEVMNCKLETREELDQREIIWLKDNEDWLIKQAQREIARRKAEQQGKPFGRGATGKKRRQRGDVSYLDETADSRRQRDGETPEEAHRRAASESVKAMLKTRGYLSKKLQLDVVDKLLGPVENIESSSATSRSRSSSVPSASIRRTTSPAPLAERIDPRLTGSPSRSPTPGRRLPVPAGRLRRMGQPLTGAALRSLSVTPQPSPRRSVTPRTSASPTPLSVNMQAANRPTSTQGKDRNVGGANEAEEEEVVGSIERVPAPSPARSGSFGEGDDEDIDIDFDDEVEEDPDGDEDDRAIEALLAGGVVPGGEEIGSIE